MNRRSFLIGSSLALLSISCIPKVQIYYAEGYNEFKKVMEEIEQNNEKIIESNYDPKTKIHTIKAKSKRD